MSSRAMKSFAGVAVSCASALALSMSSAVAQQTTQQDLFVTVQFTGGCQFTGAAPILDFGQHALQGGNTVGSQIDGEVNVNVQCSQNLPYTISLGLGVGQNASYSDGRRLTRQNGTASETVRYNLYTDSTRNANQVWGDDNTANTEVVSRNGTGNSESHTIYGRIFGNQLNVAAGIYTDTVVITVSF